MTSGRSLFSLFLTLLFATAAFAQSGGNFNINRSVIASGGGRTSGGTFTLDGTIGQPLAGVQSTGGNLSLISGFWATPPAAQTPRRPAFDFDGDGKTDVGIFRPAPAEWWYLKSSNGGNAAAQFGQTTDKIVPGDYTGDGKWDFAFFRPSTGFWYILRSEDFSFYAFPFGSGTDIPAPADYDGDGKTDAAVFRASAGTWFIQRSTDGGVTITPFGSSADLPVPADYDGDGKADVAIWRPNGANGAEWWLLRSTAGLVATVFGLPGDDTVPGDYTGDGKADIAFYRPTGGVNWYILRSEDFSFYALPFGASGDLAAPGDYDGDGKADQGVFRASQATWYLNRSTAGVGIVGFGASGDVPLQGAYIR